MPMDMKDGSNTLGSNALDRLSLYLMEFMVPPGLSLPCCPDLATTYQKRGSIMLWPTLELNLSGYLLVSQAVFVYGRSAEVSLTSSARGNRASSCVILLKDSNLAPASAPYGFSAEKLNDSVPFMILCPHLDPWVLEG